MPDSQIQSQSVIFCPRINFYYQYVESIINDDKLIVDRILTDLEDVSYPQLYSQVIHSLWIILYGRHAAVPPPLQHKIFPYDKKSTFVTTRLMILPNFPKKSSKNNGKTVTNYQL